MLILHGDALPRKREVVERARERFGIDAAPFSKLLDLREERIKPKDLDPEPLLAEYMKGDRESDRAWIVWMAVEGNASV